MSWPIALYVWDLSLSTAVKRRVILITRPGRAGVEIMEAGWQGRQGRWRVADASDSSLSEYETNGMTDLACGKIHRKVRDVSLDSGTRQLCIQHTLNETAETSPQ